MKRTKNYSPGLRGLYGLLVCVGLSWGVTGLAQDENRADRVGESGYRVEEEGQARTALSSEAENDGPVRLARFSLVKGHVSWRADENAEWSEATINLPIRQGSQVWVTDKGRAELQFDDGSLLRLGNGALVTLHTLYSDAEGEFTELKLQEGLATLNLRHEHSLYQVNMPYISLKAIGPAKIRMGVGDGVEVVVHHGQATIEGEQGKKTLAKGDYLELADARSAYRVRRIPGADSWDRWNQERDAYFDEDVVAAQEELPQNAVIKTRRHLPENIALVATDLDNYGTWHNDAEYGEVWCPRVTEVEWRPYHDGHWVWVNPFGWTWVSNEPWGWAPYHYGTWAHTRFGWAWVPGPAEQYWCPAVVNFCESDGQVVWCPLAPVEVYYPPRSHFRHCLPYFSIFAAAVYYPTPRRICEPRPFRSLYANRIVNVHNTTIVNNFGNNYVINRNTYGPSGDRGRPFIPFNARHTGVSTASSEAFGGRGSYRTVKGDATSIFMRGRNINAPLAQHAPVAGPISVRPTEAGLTPSRSFLRSEQPPKATLNRNIFRSSLPQGIEQGSKMVTPNESATSSILNGRGRSLRQPSQPLGTNSTTAQGGTPSRVTPPPSPLATVRRDLPSTTRREKPVEVRLQGTSPPVVRHDSTGTPDNPTHQAEAGRRESQVTNHSGRDAAQRARESFRNPSREGRTGNAPSEGAGRTPREGQTPNTSTQGGEGRRNDPSRRSRPSDPGRSGGEGSDRTYDPPRRSNPPSQPDQPRDNNRRPEAPRRDVLPSPPPRREEPRPEPPRRDAPPPRRETPSPPPRREEPRPEPPRRESPPPRREEPRPEPPRREVPPPPRREEPRRETPPPSKPADPPSKPADPGDRNKRKG